MGKELDNIKRAKESFFVLGKAWEELMKVANGSDQVYYALCDGAADGLNPIEDTLMDCTFAEWCKAMYTTLNGMEKEYQEENSKPFQVCSTSSVVSGEITEPYNGILTGTMLDWTVIREFGTMIEALDFMNDNCRSVCIPQDGETYIKEYFILETYDNGDDSNCVASAEWFVS